MFNIAQSFFIDPELILNAPTVYVTSIELYFKFKPAEGKGVSGINKPGVSINICPVKNGIPQEHLSNIKTLARKEYDNINISTDATSATKFTFDIPVLLSSNKQYAFVISFDDPDFVLWKNKSGEVDITSGITTKLSSSKVDGNFYKLTEGKDVTPENDVDLKFKINVAKFTVDSGNTFTVCNEAYEFLSLTSGSISNSFFGGEYVYQMQTNANGTVNCVSTNFDVFGTGTDFGNTTASSSYLKISNNDLIVISNSSVVQVRKVNVVTNTTFLNVTSAFTTSSNGHNIRTFEDGTISTNSTSNVVIGTNTSFNTVLSAGDYVVISDGTDGNTEVRSVVSVSNSSYMVLDVVPSFTNSTAGYFLSPVAKVDTYRGYSDYLTLYKSSANSTLYFQSGKTIKGVDSLAIATIDSVNDVKVSKFTPYYNVVLPAGTRATYNVNFANTTYAISANNLSSIDISKTQFSYHPSIVASRSNEVNNPSNLFANSKSMNAKLTFTTENMFVSPYVLEQNLDFNLQRFLINNSSNNESYANGSAYSKSISKIVTLDSDQLAEDLIVYMTAYKPTDTDIEVYARFLSEEDDEYINNKNWTKLELDVPTGSNIVSLNSDINDFVELKFIVPTYHSGTAVSSGTFSVTSATNVITGSYSTVNTDIVTGDVVRVYNSTFPDTYFVDSVTASNTTTITLSQNITNNDVTGVGLLIEKITDKNSAFRNNQNFNVLRYFNSSMAKFDGFNKFALKIVFKSPYHHLVPRVTEYRAIALSA